jgi:hypothetical protein
LDFSKGVKRKHDVPLSEGSIVKISGLPGGLHHTLDSLMPE